MKVPHLQPQVQAGRIKSGEPVSAVDWSTLAYGCNWVYGRGAQVIPVSAVNATVSSGSSATLNYRMPSRGSTVARRWAIVMRAETAGASATVTINGTAYDPRFPPTTQSAQRNAEIFVETLSTKPTVGSSNLLTVIVAAASGNIVVETVSCVDLPRSELLQDTTDRGVDVNTLRSRQPILDEDFGSVGGICDAEKNMAAARIGHFAWAVPTADGISPGSTSYTALFEDPVVVQAAMLDGATKEGLSCQVYAKVTGGTGLVKFTSAQAGDVQTASVTGTSFAWVTVGSSTVDVETEDLTAANGYRSGREEVTIEAADPTSQTLTIAAIRVMRGGSDYT